MEVEQLLTVDDLIQSNIERVELINGQIIKRPMARSEHALIQSGISDEISLFKRKDDGDGWWIMTEISVRYNEYQCPTHDISGWRKSRIPNRPTGIMEIVPDWVCEITSPGHERKDLFHNFMLLQSHQVEYYWVISPEDSAIIAYKLNNEAYQVIFSIDCNKAAESGKVRIPPFEATEIDTHYLFGK